MKNIYAIFAYKCNINKGMINLSNKIALHGSAKKLTQIEDVLTKLFNKNNIPFEIHLISDSEQFLREFLIKNDFRLFMVSEKGTVSYMMKMYKKL